MVGVTKIGRRNANYWINAVAEGGEDYYTKPGEAPGQWMGELAAELGLDGEISRDEYAAVFAGKHPKNGEVLVRRPEPRTFIDASGQKRRLEPILGYDIRFSLPKSVSLLWAIGSPEAQATILRAHKHAMGEALTYLERYACFVQRGKGGAVIEKGSGFISMDFLHRSSRAGDPALHSHLLTANMTRSAVDGRWLSLANPKRQSPLLREAKPAGYVFQASLRGYLTRELGVEWEAVVNGYADIAGIGRPLIEHFSQRRGDIVKEMAERGTSSAAAAEVAAYRTRDAKDYEVNPDDQRLQWRARAAEFDLTPESIDQMIAASTPHEPRPIRRADLDAALAELESKHSHFDRRYLLCELANQMREGAGVAELDRAVDGLLRSERVIEIHRGEGLLDTSYFTTPRIWEMEQRVLGAARAGEGAGVGVVGDATLNAVLARYPYLSAEQVEMVRRLTNGGERIVTVAALPGAGKTTALRAAREAWAEAGHAGLGVAAARTASGELAEGVRPATTITALLIRCERELAAGRQPLPRGTVIVVDEASTMETPYFAAIVDLAERCNGKVVCVGDPHQIGAVGPGGLYGHLTREFEPIRLTEIRRQRDPLDRQIVELAHQGQGSDALDLLRTDERLVIADTLPEALDALALDWHRRFCEGEDAVMIARRGRDVAELNARARQLQAAERRLSERSVTVAGQEFAVGDRLITRVNTPKVSNRERWEVTGVNPSKRAIALRHLGADGREVVLGSGYLKRRTENNEPAVQYAYALTTYATQSKTFETAFALLDPGVSREDFVVAVSRARGKTTAYGVAASDLLDPELGPASRDIDDPLHDLRAGTERVASEFSATEIAEGKWIENLPPEELAERHHELAQRLSTTEVSTLQGQQEALEKRISETKKGLGELREQQEKLRALGDVDRLSLVDAKERVANERLRQLEHQRDELSARLETKTRELVDASDVRLEASMIEARLLQLRRREVEAERIRPSELVVETLGPRPTEPTKAAIWNEGVNLLVAVRQVHRGSFLAGHRSQSKALEARLRSDWRGTELRLRRIQQRLGQERLRGIERDTGITR